jgi:hypothetical protein
VCRHVDLVAFPRGVHRIVSERIVDGWLLSGLRSRNVYLDQAASSRSLIGGVLDSR